MPYNDNANKSALKYKRKKQHPVTISYKKEDFEQNVKPYIDSSGMPVATFFKRAVAEKIERDFRSKENNK